MRREGGFSLAAVIVMVSVLAIMLTTAAPVYRQQAQRELEEELIFRGEEYVRAILKYQRRFGVYPPDIDALLDTNGIRFLRRAYVDPITGDEFRVLAANPAGGIEGSVLYPPGTTPLFQGGPQMTPTGNPGSGAGRGGGSGSGGGGEGIPGGGFQSGFGESGGFDSFGQSSSDFQSALGGFGGFGGATGGFQSGFGGAGLDQPSRESVQSGPGGRGGGQPGISGGFGGFGAPGSFGQQGEGGPQPGAGGGLGGFGAPGTFGQQGGVGDEPSGFGPPGSFSQPGGGGGGPDSAPQAVALSGVVGVAPVNQSPSIKVYNGRDTYGEWEFLALPQLIDAQNPLAAPSPDSGQPPAFNQSPTSPFGGTQPNPFAGQP